MAGGYGEWVLKSGSAQKWVQVNDLKEQGTEHDRIGDGLIFPSCSRHMLGPIQPDATSATGYWGRRAGGAPRPVKAVVPEWDQLACAAIGADLSGRPARVAAFAWALNLRPEAVPSAATIKLTLRDRAGELAAANQRV